MTRPPRRHGPVVLLVVLTAVGCATKAGPSRETANTTEDSAASGETSPDTGLNDSGQDTGDTDTGEDTGDLPTDQDDDGYPEEEDCDDTDPTRYPGAPEVCDDGVVNDCAGDAWSASVECGALVSGEAALATWSLGSGQSDANRVSAVGDLDGDGFDDFAAGFPKWDEVAQNTGGVFLYDGPVSGSLGLGDEDRFIPGIERWDSIGWDIAPMGDLDGDGFDDFVVGASDDHQNGDRVTGTPTAYLVHGPARISDIQDAVLLVDTSSQLECLGSVLEPFVDADGDGVADILVSGRCDNVVRLFSGATPHQVPGTDDIATFSGPTTESRFGHALATGDLNGDGQEDVAIGDPSVHGDLVGDVFVFDGPFVGSVDHTGADAAIEAEPGEGYFGAVLLGSGVAVGDLNGDGYGDLAAGAPYWTAGDDVHYPEGILVVYFGPVEGSFGILEADFRMTGEEEDNHLAFGGDMHSGQDLDGDESEDLLVGNSYIEINGVGGTLYTGGTSAFLLRGPLPSGSWSVSDADYQLTDNATLDPFGQQTAIVGDTNGDGTVEVLVGNWYDTIHLFDIPHEY